MASRPRDTSLLSQMDFSNPAPPRPVIEMLEPPKEQLDRYDSTRSIHQQLASAQIPLIFRDAMIVRQQVFVQEQKVPMENEFDSDDARSAHWVIYSDNTPQPIAIPGRSTFPVRVPVGTIRLVPFPHPAHPVDGGEYWDGKLVRVNGVAPTYPEDPTPTGLAAWKREDRETAFHDGKELYIKLGRLAIIPTHRHRKLASQLINAVIDWAIEHYTYFNPSDRIIINGRQRQWNGLILVHAQKSAARIWGRHGFLEDRQMGTWNEEGIEHVGMWRRVNVDVETAPVRQPLERQG